MRRLVLSALVLLISAQLYSQKIISLKLGSSYSIVRGLQTSSFKPYTGYHIGLGIDYIFSNPWGFKAEFVYEKKGFSYEEITSLDTRKIIYLNDYASDNLYIPILITRHFKSIFFEYGPHFNFLLNSKQKEQSIINWYTTSYLDSKTNQYDRQYFTKFDFGLTFNIGVKLLSKVYITLGVAQNFTNIGSEYSWQKYSVLHGSFSYFFGKEFIPIKNSAVKSTQSLNIKDYNVISSKNIVSYSFRRISEGDKVTFLFPNTNKSKIVSDLIVDQSSGFMSWGQNEVVLTNVTYPLHVKIQYKESSIVDNSEYTCILEFDLYKDGMWEVVIR